MSAFAKRLHFAVAVLAAVSLIVPLSMGADSPKDSKEAAKPAIQLGAPFCDNAVLQRGMEFPVWGWSKPGTKVTVEFAGQKETATAGKDGKWMVRLDKMKASFKPRKMVITDSTGKKVTLQNILVGEVWMASGQSNMQQSPGKTTCRNLKVEPVGEEKVNPIREFEVKSVTSQLHPIEKATGKWEDGEYGGYSAIALAFAHKLYNELNVPIGILHCSWSQTAIEAWVPRKGWATAKDEYGRATHAECLKTDPRTPEHKEAWSAFYKSLEDQIAESEAAVKKGEKAPEIDESVPGNMHGNRDANWMFNGRLRPVIPYAIRGAIWNQGWANRGGGLTYYHNLHNLIRGWRIVWERPDLPVYFHQFYCPEKSSRPSISSTSEMRLGTWMARDIPNAGMASQIDIGGAIHYHNKTVPGRRLALLALKNQYGKKIVAEGPMFESYEVKGDKVIVEFENAEGGLVAGSTEFNRSRAEGATGFADPKVIEDGEDKVELFWLAGEDRVWHPATFEIDGDKVVVTSKEVKKPLGVSYGSGGIGFQPCLYNKALLPMTPFIQYDHEMVLSKNWPDAKLKIAGEKIDPGTVGLLYEFRKMPVLSVQFRDNAVLQADKPVTIWGSTRPYGQYGGPAEGEGVVHFQFDDIKKTIPVEDGMDEWSVTLPAMKADGRAHTLKASFTLDGELAHERTATNIVFGDVWYVGTPDGTFDLPDVKPSGQIVRVIKNQAKRDKNSYPSRYSICVSTTPENRFAAYWHEPEGETVDKRGKKKDPGLAYVLGHSIAAKTGRPVGIIFMQSKTRGEIGQWIAPQFLKDAPSLMGAYKTVGSQYPDNPYYLANVRRYINEWKGYWGEYIPEMIKTKAVPDGARWGANWGHYPSPKPEVGNSRATQTYNVFVHCFSPATVKGVIFLSSEAMVEGDKGANFGPEMAALAKSFKSRFGDKDADFIYTVPGRELAPKISKPKKIEGASTAVAVKDWSEVGALIEKAVD